MAELALTLGMLAWISFTHVPFGDPGPVKGAAPHAMVLSEPQ